MILLVSGSGILPVLLEVQVAPEVLEEQGIQACSCLIWTCHAVLVKKVPEVVVPEEDEVDPEAEEPEAQEAESVLEVDVDHHLHPYPHSLWKVSTNRRHHLD